MNIQRYSASDCMETAQLFFDTVRTVNAKDYTKAQTDAWAPKSIDFAKWNESLLKNYALTAKTGGKIVGFSDMDSGGYLDRLYVHKDFQNMGIASALVRALEENAAKSGVFEFETYASITAKPFFKKMGYIVQRKNEVVKNGVLLINFHMKKLIK